MLLSLGFEVEEEEEAAELLRLEVNQREIRKSTRTIATPTHIPGTTHKRKPKIEVHFESSLCYREIDHERQRGVIVKERERGEWL